MMLMTTERPLLPTQILRDHECSGEVFCVLVVVAAPVVEVAASSGTVATAAVGVVATDATDATVALVDDRCHR